MKLKKLLIIFKKITFVYKGKIKAPAGENNDTWIEREQLLI